MRPIITCAKIAGRSFWGARVVITVGVAAETLVDSPCSKAPVRIVRAGKFILTR